ncbi:MAG: energy transducer TonB [Bryobacteraceae bacterium]
MKINKLTSSVLSFALFLAGAHTLQADVRVTMSDALKAAVSKPSPDYSPVARQMKVSGAVEVEATIAPDGTVENVKVLTGNPLLTSSAVKAVKNWKFTPFTVDGEPSRAVALLKFNFKP